MSANITRALIVATMLGFSSAAMARTTMSPMPRGARCTIQTACLPWQAPIGHRQPEITDISKVQPVPSDLELQALDRAIDQKLTICRGC